MLPVRQVIGRNLSRAGLFRVPATRLLMNTRFQTTAAAPAETAPQIETPRPPRSNLNPKLREIRNQVSNTVQKSDKDLVESIEILQEGLSYLREVQAAEGIDSFTIYTSFQPIATKLLEKALDPETNIGEHKVEDILDTLIAFGVAHNVHFYQAMCNEFANGDQETLYENIINIWVKYLEYSKQLQSQGINVDTLYNYLRGTSFHKYLIRDITYYSYCQSIIEGKINYDLKDATKLLQTEKIPEIASVRRSINAIPVKDKTKLFAKLNKFEKEVRRMSLENVDPNGREILKKVDEVVIYKDVPGLNRVYDQVRNSSNKNEIPLKQNTLFHIMSGYFEMESFDNVFRVFQDMLASGITNPNITIWELILRSMSHPTKVRGMKPEEKEVLVQNVEKTINTMIQQEKNISGKTLSVIVGAAANLNQFDKVDYYLEQFKDLPMVQSTKNNILIGLALNNKIAESEARMKKFMKEDPSFKPSTNYMNVLLNAYASQKKYDAVTGILEFMDKQSIPESVYTITIVIDMYFKTHMEKGHQPDVAELLKIFKSSEVKFNYFTYSVIIDGLLKDGGNMNAARSIYDYLMKQPNSKLSPHIATSMIRGEVQYGYISRAEQMFQEYIQVRNEPRMWNMMITALLGKNESLALQYYDKFKNQLVNGLQPNFFTYYFLLTHFIKRNHKDRVQMIIDDLAKANLDSYGKELPKVLQELSHTYQVPPALLNM